MTLILTITGACIVGALSAGRIARLISQDSFPPSAWLRIKWDDWTEDTQWNVLLHCHWCLTPYIVAALGAWAWLSDFHVSWWMFNLWLAVSYLAAIIVEKDEAS